MIGLVSTGEAKANEAADRALVAGRELEGEVTCWLEEGEEYDSRQVLQMVEVEGMWQGGGEMQVTSEGICGRLRHMKYMKSVPPGRASKELWQMACEGVWQVGSFEAELMRKAVADRQVLGTWQHSMTAQLNKENGKDKCQGVRLINTLCPMGKVFFGQVQEHTCEQAYDFAYGYYKNRRREQALLVDQAVAWRLGEMARQVSQQERCAWSFVRCLRDGRNAFPSVGHVAMLASLAEQADPWVQAALCTRHEKMQVEVRNQQGQGVVVRPGSGGGAGRWGDASAVLTGL